MVEVINLRQAKKQVAHKAARSAADANAAKHGRTKAERALERARAAKLSRELEGHKRETE